ncbi:MAG: hypothetical protein L6R28_13325 [Planctomycetes bacterium]|nr:hypothetical protein [Planctomycetota bacterium]
MYAQKPATGWLALTAMVALLACISLPAQEGQLIGSIRNTDTGETMTAYRNADGTTTYVTSDANGNETSRVTRGKEKDSISSTDKETGETKKLEKNEDGTHTVTQTNSKGEGTSSETHDHSKDPNGGSATNMETGITTEVYDNGDGTRTITIKDKAGKVLYRDVLPKGESIPDAAYRFQNPQPQVIYVQEPVRVVAQPVITQERRPSVSIGFGFGFGSGHKHCQPKPKKCK